MIETIAHNPDNQVRFCQEIMDLGGVKLMIETIANNPDNQVS